jgi:hypothetical protein
MPFCEWTEDDWKALIYSIRQKKCILMLGPDTALDAVEGRPRVLTESLALQLAEDFDPFIKDNINISNLTEVAQYYCLQPTRGRIDLEVKVRDFYQQKHSLCSQFHQNLAVLPFYFAITSSPDNMFYEALKRQKKEPIIGWYNFKRKKSVMEVKSTVDKPLLFYLCGTIKEPESLVLTENDLLDFLVTIISKDTLPVRLINELQADDNSLLFIGFGFKHWYLRILLHVLKIKNKASRSFALEDFAARNIDEFKSTVFFFHEGPCKIHIFERNFNSFAKELRKRYEESLGTSLELPSTEEVKRPTIFICHASEDKEYASSLYEKLKSVGYKPWLDKENLRGGDQWDEVIKKVIKKEIDYFLVLQSKNLSMKLEGYVNKEIYEARERQKGFRYGIRFIIPVKIEDCALLEEFEDLQNEDITNEPGFSRLVEVIIRDYKKRGQQ